MNKKIFKSTWNLPPFGVVGCEKRDNQSPTPSINNLIRKEVLL